MSLINEMLKNLETVPRKSMNAENVFSNLSTDISDELKKNKKYYLSIILLCLILAFLTVTLMLKKHYVPTPQLIISKPVQSIPQIAATKNIPETNKQVLQTQTTLKRLIPESLTQEKLQQAFELTKQGNETQAIQVLNEILKASPRHIKARELLVNLEIKQNMIAQAKLHAQTGLQLPEGQFIFAEQMARLLIAENNISQALRLLEQYAPPIAEYPDYHALIAALYQQKGLLTLASSLYKQLLSIEPSNSKWWLGLGVSLEEQGHDAQAAEAYANADRYGNLNPEVKAYIESRTD